MSCFYGDMLVVRVFYFHPYFIITFFLYFQWSGQEIL